MVAVVVHLSYTSSGCVAQFTDGARPLLTSRQIVRAVVLAAFILTASSLLVIEAATAFASPAHPAASRIARSETPPLLFAQAQPDSSSAASKEKVPGYIIEQYKAYVADLSSVGAQVATTETFFLTMVSALIAVFAFKERPRPTEEYFTLPSIVVFIFVSLVCLTWFLTMEVFSNLLRAKFQVLQAIEHHYPDLYPVFTEQTEHYLRRSPLGIITSGIIRQLYPLPILLGLGALTMAVAGLIRQIRGRKTSRGLQPAPPRSIEGGYDPID
jgi:thiosulfate reductase cytochrome b subunit